MAVLHSSWITSRGQLETAFKAIAKLPYGYTLKALERTRTDEQNRLMWVWLDAFANNASIGDRKFSSAQWKAILMEALGHEQEILPSLDGRRWFPAGLKTSRLGVKDFSDLLALIEAEAAHRGIILENAE